MLDLHRGGNVKIKEPAGVVHDVKTVVGFDAFSMCSQKWALCYPVSWLSAIPPEKVVTETEWQTTCLGCIAEET